MKEMKRTKALVSEYFIFVIFIALVIILTCLKPSFITPSNLVNILKQASINGILAFGMMFVIAAGGVGKPWGVVVGCLLITVIANGLDIMGVSSHWQRIVKGAIIVLAVLIDIKGKSKKN